MRKFILAFAFIVMVSLGCTAQVNDQMYTVGPGACSGSPSANAVAPTGAAGVGTGLTTQGANFMPVFQVSSSAAATDTISCVLTCPTRTSTGKGCTIFGFGLHYGVLTTAATSESAPVCQINAYPSPAAGETASTVAGTNIPVTAVPVVGSANLGTVTAGQEFTQWITFTTPQALNGPFSQVVCTFAFGQTAASAMVIYTSGGEMLAQQIYS